MSSNKNIEIFIAQWMRSEWFRGFRNDILGYSGKLPFIIPITLADLIGPEWLHLSIVTVAALSNLIKMYIETHTVFNEEKISSSTWQFLGRSTHLSNFIFLLHICF